MTCDRCQNERCRLIEIFHDCRTRDKKANFGSKKTLKLCGDCLKHEFVPVWRKSRKAWNIGQVLNISREDVGHEKFLIAFGASDNDKEWLEVESKPFEAYVHFYLQEVSHRKADTGQMPETNNGPLPTHQRTPSPENRESANKVTPHVFQWPPTPVKTQARSSTSVSKKSTPHDSTFRDQLVAPSYWSPLFNRNAHPNGTPNKDDSATTRLWTIKEDKVLLRAIASSQQPIKWKLIASHVPNRSGKQCRERYFNHLKPALIHSDWSPVEDYNLYHIHNTSGPKWSIIATVLRGRTNNSVKNRFHTIRRRCEKEIQNKDKKLTKLGEKLKEQVVQRLVSKRVVVQDNLIRHVVNAVEGKGFICRNPFSFVFDLSLAKHNEVCSRCGLTAPSRQTGTKICRKTGWCQSCTQVSPYIHDDLLRIVHDLISTSSGPE